MNQFVQVSSLQYEKAFELILLELEKQLGSKISSLNIDDFVLETLTALQSSIDDSRDNKIIIYSIKEIVNHWKAIQVLRPQGTIGVHCRKILECSVIVRFLIDNPKAFNKYLNKWELFQEVTMFNGWARLDKESIHPETQRHMELMKKRYSEKYKDYEIFFSKKRNIILTGTLLDDIPLFRNVKSWLSPNSLEDILEMDPQKNVPINYYTWWSSSIHFSPLNQTHYNVTTPYGSFNESSYLYILLEISAFVKSASKKSSKENEFKIISKTFYYKYLLERIVKDPGPFLRLVEYVPKVFAPLSYLALGRISIDRYMTLAMNKD
jgi:hypothetical protein